MSSIRDIFPEIAEKQHAETASKEELEERERARALEIVGKY